MVNHTKLLGIVSYVKCFFSIYTFFFHFLLYGENTLTIVPHTQLHIFIYTFGICFSKDVASEFQRNHIQIHRFFFFVSPLCYNSLEFRTLFMFAIRWAWNIVQRHPEKRTRVCVNVVIESILIWITQARQYTNAVSSENVWHFSEHNQCDKTQLFMEKCCFSISFPSVSLV